MTEYNLTLEDIADRLGMHPRYLTNKKNGPVTRVLETYYWRDDLTDGDSYSEAIVKLLEDYLSCCGKRGEGIDFDTWQRSTWELNEIEPTRENSEPSHDGILTRVAPPVVEVLSPDDAISSLGESISSFKGSIDGFDAYFDAIGEQIGNRAVSRVASATQKSIDDGLSKMLNNFSKLGDN